MNISFIKLNTVFWFLSKQDLWKRHGKDQVQKVSPSPYRRHETSRFRELPHPLAMMTLLMDSPQNGGPKLEKLSKYAENLYMKVYWVADYESDLIFLLWIRMQKFFRLLITNLTFDSRNSRWRIHCSCWIIEKLSYLD